MRAITSAASAICGTHFGDTNDAASIAGRPASVRRSMSATLTSVAIGLLLVLQPVARADLDDAGTFGKRSLFGLREVDQLRAFGHLLAHREA